MQYIIRFIKAYYIYVVFIVIALGCSLLWLYQTNGVFGTDTIFTLTRGYHYIDKYYFLWNEYSSLGQVSMSYSRWFLGFLEKGINNNYIVQLFVFSFVLYTSLCGMGLLLMRLYNVNKINYRIAIFSILYTFGPFSYYYVFRDQTGFMFFQAIFPLILLTLIKILFDDNKYYLLLLLVVVLFFSTGLSHILIVSTVIFCVPYLIYILFNRIKSFRLIGSYIVIIIGGVSWLLLPYISYIGQGLYMATSQSSISADIATSSTYSSIRRIVSFVGYKILYEPYLGGIRHINSASNYFLSLPYITYMMLLFMIIVARSFFGLRRKRNVLVSVFGIGGLLVLGLSSSVGLNAMAELSQTLATGLRNAFNKFAIPMYCSFVILLFSVFEGGYSKSRVIKWVECAIVGLIIFPFMYSSPIYQGSAGLIPSYKVQIPDEYMMAKNELINITGNVLILPLMNYGVGYYSWIRIDNKMILEDMVGGGSIGLQNTNPFIDQKINDIDLFLQQKNYDGIIEELEYFRIRKIIFDDNIDRNLRDKGLKGVANKEDYQSYKDWLFKRYNYTTYGKIDIIDINVRPRGLFEYGENGLLLNKINPTKYSLNLTIPATSTGEELSFLQSYHREWKLYPGRPIDLDSCEDVVYYSGSTSQTDSRRDTSAAVISTGVDGQQIRVLTHVTTSGELLADILSGYRIDLPTLYQYNSRINTIVLPANTILKIPLPISTSTSGDDIGSLTWGPTSECVRDGYTFFQGEELTYLWRQPLRDDTHEMIYDYANGWTIDLNMGTLDSSLRSEGQIMLQQGLREGWTTENPDGSYNVSLTLYFRPQSWFYLGLLISGTTFIGLIGWLLRDYRNKQKLPH